MKSKISYSHFVSPIIIAFFIFSLTFTSYFVYHYNFNSVIIPPYFDFDNHLKAETYEEIKNYEPIATHLEEFKNYWIIQSLKVSSLISAVSFFLIYFFKVIKKN